MRPVYKYRAEYPRFLGVGKGATYYESNTKKWSSAWAPETGDFAPIGYIPETEMEETYGYVDGGYGVMNEIGLTIGESTCAAELIAKPAGSDGSVALLDIRELTLIAMERCATSVCAVQTMGALAEAYGYYGADSSHVEAGEALTIADRVSGEAWVFHILADDTGASAVWTARRLKNREIAVVANQFIIGDIPGASSIESGFLFSANIRVVAARTGLWANGEPLNFAKTFGQPRGLLAPYATRRQWRIFSMALGEELSKTLLIDPDTVDEWGYDFAIELPPGQTFGSTSIMKALRDHYEGTKYDMTQGPASGPFGDPARFDPADNSAIFPHDYVTATQANDGGRFERAISIFRCSYSFVSQPALFHTTDNTQEKDYLNTPPAFWTAQYAPHSASYVLIFPQADHIPPSLATGSLHQVDSISQYWAHALVGNWAARFYLIAQPLVVEVRDDVDKQTRADFRDLLLRNKTPNQNELATFADAAAAAAVDRWWKLFWDLCARVKDGQRLDDRGAEKLNPTRIFYRASWLQQTGFFFNPQQGAHMNLFTNIPSQYYDLLNPRLQLALAFLAGMLFTIILLRCCCGCRAA
uniref:Dipeptidase n=1 Tax=Aureoumbra lagunensis TaxID=44058 RepID=A0A7S3K181_9STRA